MENIEEHNQIEKIKKRRGRPSIGEVNLAKFRQKSFYYPIRLEKVFKEFDRLAKKEIRNQFFPERSKSILIRKFILEFVYKNTDKDEIRNMIKDYMLYEKERLGIDNK